MANYNAFGSNNSSSNSSNNVQQPTQETQESNMWVWGEVPEGQHLIVETTLSGNSFKMPQPTDKVTGGTLANIWPGKINWTAKGAKQAGTFRLFAKLNAMVLDRDANGVPVLDKEEEFVYKDGAQFSIRKQGLSKEVKGQIKQLESAKGENPALTGAIDEAVAKLKASASWITKKLDSKSFVSGLLDSGDTLLPVLMYINFPMNGKESLAFVKEVAKLNQAGEPGLLRFYLPMERLSMPKDKWEAVKINVNGQTVDMKDPRTGETVMAPVFSWGNKTQPIARIELVHGKYLPSSQGMDRVLSLSESLRRVELMQREWESSAEGELALWEESLKGKFASNGNRWAMKAGALPALTMGQYAATCSLWEDAKSSPAKFDKWAEKLISYVGVKPRLDQEKGKGLGDKFSQAACDAILASAKVQSIEPWVNFVGKPIVTPVATPVVVIPEVEVEVNPVTLVVEETTVVTPEPEVQALETEEIDPQLLAMSKQTGIPVEELLAIAGNMAGGSLEDLDEEEEFDTFFDPKEDDDNTQV